MTVQAPRIDHSYRKDTVLPVGQGYSVRPGGIRPSSIVIHTTSNAQPTSFAFEAKYLQMSRDVSAHFLVGKAGEIVQFLSPDLMAWHAGAAIAAWKNEHSIGIEHHVSVGEAWTDAQHAASTWLVRWLMALYVIAPPMIETHRKIALPAGRKSDPAGWGDAEFYAWRGSLIPIAKTYVVRGLPVYQRSDRVGVVAGYVHEGDTVDIDNPENGHLSSGLGFLDMNGVTPV